jgi:hypothetical protein
LPGTGISWLINGYESLAALICTIVGPDVESDAATDGAPTERNLGGQNPMSMAINSGTVGIAPSSESTQPTSATQSAILGSVSQLLGVSTSQLQSSLSSGQSLQSIASNQGVPSSQLVSTIAQSLQSSNPSISSSQASTMATNISQRVGGSSGGHHHHRGGGSSESASGTSSSASSDATSELLQLLGAASTSSTPSTSSTSSSSLSSSLLNPTTQSGQAGTGSADQEVDMYL